MLRGESSRGQKGPFFPTSLTPRNKSNEKPVSRQHLKKLSVLLGIAEDELLTLWLADKVYDVVKDEEVAIKAMHVAEDHVLKTKNKKERADSNEYLFYTGHNTIY